MASTRFSVVSAVKALVAAAVPAASIKGLDNDAAFPTRVPSEGLAVVRDGDPGAPEVDLSPPSYRFDHTIPIELAFPDHAALDDAKVSIGLAIAADRHLGGLCEWIDVTAPEVDDIRAEGGGTAAGTILAVVATYSTTNPLT